MKEMGLSRQGKGFLYSWIAFGSLLVAPVCGDPQS